jgi:hypothetical protein
MWLWPFLWQLKHSIFFLPFLSFFWVSADKAVVFSAFFPIWRDLYSSIMSLDMSEKDAGLCEIRAALAIDART